jgi:hypothetical protein
MYELHVYILMANKQAIYAFAAACVLPLLCHRPERFISLLLNIYDGGVGARKGQWQWVMI